MQSLTSIVLSFYAACFATPVAARRLRLRHRTFCPGGIIAIVAGIGIVGCEVMSPPDGAPASISIEPAEISLRPGDTAVLSWAVRDARGRTLKQFVPHLKLSDPSLATVTRSGVLTAQRSGMLRITAECCGMQAHALAAIGDIRFDNVREVATAQFNRLFGFSLSHVPVAVDVTERDTNRLKSPTRFISVVHGTRMRYFLELWPDGSTRSFAGARPVLPAGEIRVGIVVVDHPFTDFVDLLGSDWRIAVDSVNADHRWWATSAATGSAPIVSIQPSVVVVPAAELGGTIDGHAVRAALDARGIDYHIPALVNLDPYGTWGGTYHRGQGYISVGCLCQGYTPGLRLRLTSERVHEIAQVLLHHELGHAMGWEHAWGGGPPRTRLITDPALMGWVDVTGNGFAEILSPNPYGSTQRLP
jgi:hypothetical protein